MNELQDYIDRYYEARLSRDEERYLLRQLLNKEGQDPAADEVLAVMLASRMIPKATKRSKRAWRAQTAGIAASIALILGTGAFLIIQPHETQSFAYVSGKKTNDPDEIRKIVATQLQDIGETTDLFNHTVSADLEDIREALTSEDI